MKTANVAESKNRLSEHLAAENAPLARVVPSPARQRNRTVLGSGRGSVIVKKSLVDPLIPLGDWEMLGEIRRDGRAQRDRRAVSRTATASCEPEQVKAFRDTWRDGIVNM